ncbi:MAG: AraC family transcriptional regulator [Pseudomonadota bacterium]
MTIASASPAGILSVRTYTLSQDTHAHEHHQVVVPLNGAMEIGFGDDDLKVPVGSCVVIRAGQIHRYAAPEKSRFLVADMETLPANAEQLEDPCVTIAEDLLAFCVYADVQLRNSADPDTGRLLYQLFFRLLEQQAFSRRLDRRILRAVSLMEEDLSVTHPVENLAAAAHLSVSQFKALFKKCTGLSASAYLTGRRMDRARTLLVNTDYPVSVIAADVGYEDASAFTRRFNAHFGQSPREFARTR